jgi:hypothetical protein
MLTGDPTPISTLDTPSNQAAIDKALKGTPLDQISSFVNSNSNYLRSAIQSTLNTFDKTTNSLASGINTRLAGIFKNTNVASASTVSTRISDPVASNLLASKKPTATSWRVTGGDTGSQALTSSRTTAGTGAAQMTGTSLTTLLNRFKTDIGAATSLPTVLANKVNSNQMNALFNKAIPGGSSTVSSLSSAGSLVSVSTGKALTQTLGTSKSGFTDISFNDLTQFQGQVSPVSTAFGGRDFSGYYYSGGDYSLMTRDGSMVNTNKSGVDANTANAILGLVRTIGCSVTNNEYLSTNQVNSLFGLGLLLAALEGMVDLVTDLLNCSHASGQFGQQALARAFTQSSGSQLGVAGSILDKIDAPQSLYTPDLSYSILTNPSLSASNKSSVDSIFGKLGTDTKSEFMVPGVSSNKYPVYNGALIPQVQMGFTNAIFQDTTLTDYFQGQRMGVGSNGKLSLYT